MQPEDYQQSVLNNLLRTCTRHNVRIDGKYSHLVFDGMPSDIHPEATHTLWLGCGALKGIRACRLLKTRLQVWTESGWESWKITSQYTMLPDVVGGGW